MQIEKPINSLLSEPRQPTIQTRLITPLEAGKANGFETVLKDVMPCYEPKRQLPGRISNTEIREGIMKEARSSPEAAYKLAHDYALNSLEMPLVTSLTVTPQRYATGELVTAESKAYFENTMLTMQRERTELYRSEMEKGTPPVEVLEKILTFNDSLPPRFLDMCAW